MSDPEGAQRVPLNPPFKTKLFLFHEDFSKETTLSKSELVALLYLLCYCYEAVSELHASLPCGAMGLSVFCDCLIFWSYSLSFYVNMVALFLFVLLLYVPSQQLWSWLDGQFT